MFGKSIGDFFAEYLHPKELTGSLAPLSSCQDFRKQDSTDRKQTTYELTCLKTKGKATAAMH